MTRIYVCPVIGSGTEDDPQRAALVDVVGVTRCRSAISVDNTGRPRFNWVVCMVEATDWVAVEAVGRVVRVDEEKLDDTIPTAKRTALSNEVGDEIPIKVDATSRQVIRQLVQAHYPYADEKAMLS